MKTVVNNGKDLSELKAVHLHSLGLRDCITVYIARKIFQGVYIEVCRILYVLGSNSSDQCIGGEPVDHPEYTHNYKVKE